MSAPWKPIDEDFFKIAHISDLHIGSPNADAVWQVVDTFLTGTLKPDLVIVTGDLVHTPDPELYKQAYRKLEALRMPYFVCAGNHDRHVLGNRVELEMLRSNRVVRLILNSYKWLLGLVVLLLGVAAWQFGWLLSAVVIALGLLIVLFLEHIVLSQVRKKFSSGNASAVFDQRFMDKFLTQVPRRFPLGTGPSKWKLGLFGLDSSINADCFARGHVPTHQILALSRSVREQPNNVFDLTILAVHHHLLSVRKLEPERESNSNDLLNATCLVNTGALLERLSESRIDIVLHGHEHEPNWGSYRSLEDGFGNVHIVGAGSVTGNDSFAGCGESRATLNVLLLAADRSVRLRRAVLESSSWCQEMNDDVLLMTPAQVRHGTARRRLLSFPGAEANSEVTSEIIKHFAFTRERDIRVEWIMTDWWLDTNTFRHSVWNSTGVPTEPQVVLAGEQRTVEVTGASFAQVEGSNDEWRLTWKVPDEFLHRRVNITIRFRWKAGALLTIEELQALKERRISLDSLRHRGYECATTWSREQPVSALQLHVDLPPEYAPELVEVFVTQDGTEYPDDAKSLQKHFHILAPGQYSLRIAYPHVGREYTLRWRPVPERTASDKLKSTFWSEQFVRVANANGDELVREFVRVFEGTPPWSQATAALYVRNNAGIATRVGAIPIGDSASSVSSIPNSIELRTERNIMVQAWWGVPAGAIRQDDAQASEDAGFCEGESLLVCIPIRDSLYATNPPPWGVLRIGVSGVDQAALESMPLDVDVIIERLQRGISLLIAKSFELAEQTQ